MANMGRKMNSHWGCSNSSKNLLNIELCVQARITLFQRIQFSSVAQSYPQCRGIGPHLAGSGKSHGFSRFAQEPGVYSRVTAGMSIRNSSLFIEVRNLSRYEGQLRNIN